MFNKKTLCVVAGITAALVSGAGCAAEQEQAAEIVRPSLTWYVHYSWFNTEWGEDAVSRYISDRTGIDVTYVVPYGSENDYLQTLIAKDDLPDLMTMGHTEPQYYELLRNEQLASLSELAQTYGAEQLFASLNPQTLEWYTDAAGDMYSYPNASYPIEQGGQESNQTFLVRKDIYEAIGSPDMSTPEGFLAALAAAKEAFPTVDGKTLIPIGFQEFNEFGNPALESYLQDFLGIPFEVDGQYHDRFLDEESIRWLKMLNEANRQGLIAVDVFADKRVQMEEKIEQGRYFAMLYQWSDCQTQLKTRYENDPESAYIAIDGPKNAQGDPHRLSGSSVQGWTVTSLAKTSDEPEAAIQLLDYLASDDGQKALWAGVEGVTYTMEDETIVFEQAALAMLHTDRLLFDQTYGADATHWPMMNNAYAAAKSYIPPETAYFEDMIDWTKQYAVNNSLYVFTYEPNSAAELVSAAHDLYKGELIPQLLLAESEAAFDAHLEAYQAWRDANRYDSVIRALQQQIEENKLRLGVENE